MSELLDSASNKWRSLLFRDSILIELHEGGLPEARRPAVAPGPGAAFRESATIEGLPFYIACHQQKGIELASAQDDAEQAARAAGIDLWASVQYRRGRPLQDAYVTLPLKVFMSVIHQLPASRS